MWNNAASMSLIGEQQLYTTAIFNLLTSWIWHTGMNRAGICLRKKNSCAPPSHLPCITTTLSTLEAICSLSKVEGGGNYCFSSWCVHHVILTVVLKVSVSSAAAHSRTFTRRHVPTHEHTHTQSKSNCFYSWSPRRKWVRVEVASNIKFSSLRRQFQNESWCIFMNVHHRGGWCTPGTLYRLQQSF